MPLTTRIFNFIEGLDPNDIGVGEKLVQKYEKLLKSLRGKANRSQLARAYRGEPANFGLKLGGMDELHDLKALGEYLGFEEAFDNEERLVRAQAVIDFQSEGDVLSRIAEVGTPSAIQDALSEFRGATIERIEADNGGFSSGGVNKSLNLFLNNWLTENRIFSVEGLPENGAFIADAERFVQLIEARESIANNSRILNEYDPDNNPAESELQAYADALEIDIAEANFRLQGFIEQDRQVVNQAVGANPNSLVTRTYKQSIDSQFIEGYENVDVANLSFSLIPDDAWESFLTANEFSPEVREFFETHKDMVEQAYDDRGDKTVSFNTWSFRDYAPEAEAIRERFAPVAMGWHTDPTLDPLINKFLEGVPVAYAAHARERFREFIASVRQGPNKDKSALWVEFVNNEHGETPDQVLNRYIGDVLSSKPGGREFVEAARVAGIQLKTLASDSGEPIEWLKSITDNGVAMGLPPVSEADLKQINTRAWAIEMFSMDTDMRNAPAVVREEIYTEITRQLQGQGLDPLTTGNRLDYVQQVSQIGIGNIKSNVLESIVRNSGPEGDALWEDLKRKQGATGIVPDSILAVFNDIEGLDKNTLLLDNLNAQLEETAKTLGPTPEEAARAGFAELTRNLPSEFQGTANARIQTFLNSFVGEDPEAVLARQDVQDRIALIVEGVGQQILGESEVVELAVAQFGGLNEFFAAFPELQESDVGTIQDFVVDNFDTILAGAGPDAEVAELQKAKARVEQERLKDELTQRREALNLVAEGRALEFDESAQGRQLAELQETEGRRQEQLAVFQPELERAVRGTISGPAASQVLADVSPQLQRQFLAQREATFAAQQAGANAVDISPQDFLGQLDQDFFIKERRRSNIRRTPVNVAAPQFAGLGSTNDGPGFSRQGGR
jgi:hypothetical protein